MTSPDPKGAEMQPSPDLRPDDGVRASPLPPETISSIPLRPPLPKSLCHFSYIRFNPITLPPGRTAYQCRSNTTHAALGLVSYDLVAHKWRFQAEPTPRLWHKDIADIHTFLTRLPLV
jgi:hypothetical protein